MSKALEISNGFANLLRSKLGLTSDEEEALFAKRREICDACPLIYFDQDLKVDRCNGCGCLIAVKTKSITSECPEGLW